MRFPVEIPNSQFALGGVLHLIKRLKKDGKKKGIASICIGGGLGGAMLVEAL